MPVHTVPAPVYIPTPLPVDSCLLDEEFDNFEIPQPCGSLSELGMNTLLYSGIQTTTFY